jgi:4-hydroxy-2-oxoheptanedioate aldolase
LIELIRTIQYHSQGSMVPFVRIPSYTPELIAFALNAGAGGILMPRVQNAKQAEELIRLSRFPPLGERGFPPAALIGEGQNRTPNGMSAYDVWNSHAAVICQIEDLVGLENVDEICGVPGGESCANRTKRKTRERNNILTCPANSTVDGIFVGTGDLRLSMGLAPGSLDGDETEFVAALEKIRDAAKARGLPIMGFGLSPSILRQRVEMGWSAFIVHGDIDAICQSAKESLELFSRATKATNGHAAGADGTK